MKLTKAQKKMLEEIKSIAAKNTKDGHVDVTIDLTARDAGILRRALDKVAIEGIYNGLSIEFGQGATESKYSGYRSKSENNAPVVYVTGAFETTEKKIKEVKIKKLIGDSIGANGLGKYLTAEYGETLGLYADGSVTVGQDVGHEMDSSERPVAWVNVPGIGNIDTEYWTEHCTENDNGEYVDDEGKIFSFSGCIWDCIKKRC